MADADEQSARQHLEIIRQVQRDFTKRNALMKEIDQAIFLKRKPRVPRGFPNTTKVQSPLAPHIVNTITAALSMNPYKVLFEPVSIGPTGEQNARLREHFFNASWRRQEKERRSRTFRNFMHGVVAYGEGVFKTVERTKTVWAPYDDYSAELQADLKDVNHPQYGDVARAYHAGDTTEHDRIYQARTEEKKRELLYPIRTLDIAPSTFFYIKGDDGFTYCCEEKYVPYYSTLERYGKGNGTAAVDINSNGNIVPEGLGVGQAKWTDVMSGSRQLTMYEAWKWDECFPRDTAIELDSRVQGVSRRWYVGEVVEITTASGKKLTGTPNHPILTDAGEWVGIGLLMKGDYVVHRRGSESYPAVNHDADNPKPCIGNIFDLAAEVAPSARCRRASTEKDFHGDGQDGYIDVVTLDGVLWDGIEATLAQECSKKPFPPADVAFTGLPGERELVQPCIALDRSTNSNMGGFGLEPSLLVGHVGLANTHGLGDRPQHDATSTQALVDSRGGVAIAGRQDRSALTSLIGGDQVTNVVRRPFAGYVYNLHTESNRYIANGIVVHNCVYILCGPNDDISKGQGRIVKRIKDHGYGNAELKTLRGPYFHAFGITTSSRELHLQGLSVLFGFLKLFPWLDELLTIQGAAAYQYGYPRYRRRGNNGNTDDMKAHMFSRDEQDRIDKESVVEPGDILGIDIEPVESPSSGPDLGVAIKICRDLLELALPSIVQGAVDGTESGYLAAQATHLARLIWQPIVDNTEFCCEERTAFESWLIDEMIGEDVYVWGEEPVKPGLKKRKPRMMWLGIGPDDIKSIHHYGVKLDPSTPSQDVIKVRTHDEMLKLKLETLTMARMDMGFNPEEVEQGWMLDELKAQLLPDIIAAAKAKILAKQQANAAESNLAEIGNGAGGAANGRLGAGDVIQPGQNGEPLQPTPAGQAGVQNVSPAGGISSQGGGTPVVPSPAPPAQVIG